MTPPEQVTKLQPDGVWWSTYDDGVQVWASGPSAAKADSELLRLVPWPYRAGADDADVITAQVGETWFAACVDMLTVVSTGPSEEDARSALILHVPVPQPTEQGPTDYPPRLEDKPLPPV